MPNDAKAKTAEAPHPLDALAEEIYRGENLSSYAAHAAATELIGNWKAALNDGSPINELVGDVDDVIAILTKFKTEAAQIAVAPATPSGREIVMKPFAHLEGLVGRTRAIIPDDTTPPEGFILAYQHVRGHAYIEEDLTVQRRPEAGRLYRRVKLPVFRTAEDARAWKSARATDDPHKESVYGSPVSNARVLEIFEPVELKPLIETPFFQVAHADPEFRRQLVEVQYLNSPNGDDEDENLPKRRLFLLDGDTGETLGSMTIPHRRGDSVTVWNSECQAEHRIDPELYSPGLPMGLTFGSLEECSSWAMGAREQVKSLSPNP